MIEFIQNMGPGDWLTAAGMAIALLSALSGGVWWMSAVYGKLNTTCDEVKEISLSLSESNNRWGTESERHWQVHEQHRSRIENHEGRIIRLESHES